jgi:hypothetical protein
LEQHRADPAARRTAWIVMIVIAAVGGSIIFATTALRPQIEEWVLVDVRSRLTIVIGVLTVLAAGPPLALAAYLFSFGRQVVAAARFPPPGARLMQDTPVITGDAARRRGRTLQIFAAGVGVSALVIAVVLIRLAVLLRAR